MPSYYWNPERQVYEDAETGKEVSPSQVREWIDGAIENSSQTIEDISLAFIAGSITLAAWQTQIQAEIKAAHTAMAVIAIGGTKQFTPQLAGRLGARLREQYAYLRGFGLAIEQEQVAKDDALVARAKMYAEAPRVTYEGMRRGNMVTAGFTEEHSVLGASDHCEECIEQEALGWVEIGMLVPIGSRQCITNCHCLMKYR